MTLEPLKLNVPEIAPVPKGIHRPFWSVMIPIYNPTHYLKQTLQSVLEQAPDPDEMQIEVVDDCSTQEGVEALVTEIGQGRVSFYRQPQNVGLGGNWNTCIQRASGHWVHILHQDDAVKPGFYSQLRASLELEPTIGAAFCRFILMDKEGRETFVWPLERETPGILENWIERIAVEPVIQTPAIVVKRSVYEQLGGYNPELIWAIDWEMWQRIATHYPFWYEPQPLACYRLHDSTESSRLKKTGENIADVRKAIEITQSYLPQAIAKEIETRAKEYWALFALRTARHMLALGDTTAVAAQIQESLKCSNSPNVINSLLSLQAQKSNYDFTGLAQWNQIKGNSSMEKAVVVQQIVKQLPAGSRIVELGCFQGRNSVAIAAVLPPGSMVYCVDDFQGSPVHKKAHINSQNLLETFISNIERCGVKDKISTLAMNPSAAAAKFELASVDLLFLDHDPDYDSVQTDLLNWYPKLKPGGYLLCDNYEPNWPGVMRAIKTVGLEGQVVAGSLWVHRKPLAGV